MKSNKTPHVVGLLTKEIRGVNLSTKVIRFSIHSENESVTRSVSIPLKTQKVMYYTICLPWSSEWIKTSSCSA